MTRPRTLILFSPAAVVMAMSCAVALGCRGDLFALAGLAVLALALAAHVREMARV